MVSIRPPASSENMLMTSKRNCVWFKVNALLTVKPPCVLENITGSILAMEQPSTSIINLNDESTYSPTGNIRPVTVNSYVPSCLIVPRLILKPAPNRWLKSAINASAKPERHMLITLSPSRNAL